MKMMKKVMIVDDEPDILYSLKQELECLNAGYDVVSASDGRECLKLLDHGLVPDIILLDIMMPEISGWDVFDRLKKNPSWKDIPIVFLTARTDVIARDAGDFLGEDYIQKPFKIKDLKKRIDIVLNNKKAIM
jgi:CheY-like chemotaxis protein